MDSRQGAFFTAGDDATPRTAGAIVLVALIGIWALRKLKVSVSASL